jgi:hypothetical protein
MAHEGVRLIVIQRELGQATSASRPSTSKASTSPEVIDAVYARRGPMVPVSASLQL